MITPMEFKNMTPEEQRSYIESRRKLWYRIEADYRKKHPEWTEEQIAEAMRGVFID